MLTVTKVSVDAEPHETLSRSVVLRHEPLLNRVETQDFGRREGADVQPSPIVVVDQHHFVDLKSILINRDV